MDGLLVVDKPVGPTSHDVVVSVRLILREPRVGHTGTLDPAASGVLPLVIGRATRLARFMSTADKTYDAIVRLGVATDTCDATGQPVGPVTAGPFPDRQAIDRALDPFRGTFLQQPPAYSAKKIGGKRSHRLARAAAPVVAAAPAPVAVTARAIELISVAGDRLRLRVECSAGFYVRALAQDLGERIGTGAYLEALIRTRSGSVTLADALPLATIEADPRHALAAVQPLGGMLQWLAPLTLTDDGVRRARHGCDLRPVDFNLAGPSAPAETAGSACVRLLDGRGDLVGVAEPARASGLLHPAVVLV